MMWNLSPEVYLHRDKNASYTGDAPAFDNVTYLELVIIVKGQLNSRGPNLLHPGATPPVRLSQSQFSIYIYIYIYIYTHFVLCTLHFRKFEMHEIYIYILFILLNQEKASLRLQISFTRVNTFLGMEYFPYPLYIYIYIYIYTFPTRLTLLFYILLIETPSGYHINISDFTQTSSLDVRVYVFKLYQGR